MIRLFLVFVLIFSLLDAKTDIDTQIKQTSKRLNSFSKSYTSINKKMSQNAKAILKQKQAILKGQKEIEDLTSELKEKESKYKENIVTLKKLEVTQKDLAKEQQKIENELIFTIAQSVSLSVILEEEYAVNEKSLIEFEVLKEMLNRSKAKAKKLNKKFYNTSKNITSLSNEASSLKKQIASIDAKRKKLISIQKRNKKALKKLERSKLAYKKELKKLLKKQDTLKRTLSKLNIIKIDEAKKAKEEAARKKAFQSKKIISDKDLPKVKKHGSSYQRAKTKRYRGPKTIAPLESYTITKKYGTYTDPIYGIKVFNESISLKPKRANAKVKTVFNGKVIYADKTAVLDNIVIIQHKNGLHTIYANLSKIAPNIKKGKRVKKGSTIGRVKNELVFEVTQKSYHINPIRLFK